MLLLLQIQVLRPEHYLHPRAALLLTLYSCLVWLTAGCAVLLLQIQVLRPVHYLHPRAVLLVVLYRSLMSDPHVRNRIPRRLRTCLEFHRTMILYDGYPATVVDDEGDVFQPAQEEPEVRARNRTLNLLGQP